MIFDLGHKIFMVNKTNPLRLEIVKYWFRAVGLGNKIPVLQPQMCLTECSVVPSKSKK